MATGAFLTLHIPSPNELLKLLTLLFSLSPPVILVLQNPTSVSSKSDICNFNVVHHHSNGDGGADGACNTDDDKGRSCHEGGDTFWDGPSKLLLLLLQCS